MSSSLDTTAKQKVLKKWPDARCFRRDDVAKNFQIYYQVWNPPGYAVQLLGMAKSAAAAWADALKSRVEKR